MTGIERLREVVRELGRFSFCYDLYVRLSDIAEQIERELNASVADSPYDAILPEEREAIAWVRDHGGLDAVKRRWECLSYCADPVPRSYAERRIASRQRQIDESHAALRRRNERIAELERERNELYEMVRQLNARTDEMEKHLMPEGMELEGNVLKIRTAKNVDYDRETLFVLIGGGNE